MSNLGISRDELKQVLLLDAKEVSTNPEKYAEANHDVYTVVSSTWLRMCNEVCGSLSARVLRNSILMKGLLWTIRECERIANVAIRSDFKEVVGSPLSALFTEDPRLTLQVLRYAKRFSPLNADKILAEGKAEFLRINKSLKGQPMIIDDEGRVIKRTCKYPKWLIESVRWYLHEMLGNPTITDEAIALEGNFSTGYSGDPVSAKTFAEKAEAFAGNSACYLHYSYPLSSVITEPSDSVVVVAVPKNYKAPRIIAKVPTFQQFHMQGLRKLMERQISKSPYCDLIVLDDQRINQEWSRLGSVYGCYATIDLSAASDSISQNLAEQVLPSNWFRAIDRWNPPMIEVDGKKYVRYIFLTSGSGVTFLSESSIFLAVALSATEYVRIYTQEWIADPRVYGDDIICDDRVYDTLVCFLELLGFKVNLDKSFTGTSRYRESCGAEWFCGLDTATKYFPRKQIRLETPEGLQSLISLQHRLYEFKSVDDWFVNYIRKLAKARWKIDMTSSYPGTDCDDLWEDFPMFKVINPPFDHDKLNEAPANIRREGHYALLPNKAKLSVGNTELVDMIRYVDFLRHGPSYETALDELLKVSMKRDVVSEHNIVPLVWRITK